MEIKVKIFAEKMQRELDNNSHKGNWEDFIDADNILSELNYHYDKLYRAYIANDKRDIEECIADSANILMFLGNSFNLYNK
jgi:hypothetical protein